MEDIISSLLQIEEDASAVLQNTDHSRKLLSDEHDQRIRAFDESLEKETSEKIRQIHEEQETRKESCLKSLREKTAGRIAYLEDYYEKNHENLARQLFQQIINEPLERK